MPSIIIHSSSQITSANVTQSGVSSNISNTSNSNNSNQTNTNTQLISTSNSSSAPASLGAPTNITAFHSNNKTASTNSKILFASTVGNLNIDEKHGGNTGRCNSPPLKKIKCDSKDMVDVCVGTSVGTITEPDCLGPCEPGTSVTLEGIVWHETEGGKHCLFIERTILIKNRLI